MQSGPMAAYQARTASGDLKDDAAQKSTVAALQKLYDRLGNGATAGTGFLQGLRRKRQADAPKGLYIWGGVGRGKSMLMDLFFDTAPVEKKRRVHFHAFMQEIHDGMAQARTEGTTDPVQVVADAVVRDAQLLCFDELQITDITDAMIVGRLFDKLFAQGVTVVTTSNRHPDDLYQNGLNRQLFLPFIAMIKDRLDIHHLMSDTDHRQASLADRSLYFTPLGAEADASMDALWAQLSGGAGGPLRLALKGRDVIIPQFSNGTGRGSFADFCEQPLGPADFLRIAGAVTVLMIDNIPTLSRAKNNEAKRFVTLIDALYEDGTQLVCSAAAEPDALYVDGAGAFEFERTASRLIEMRSGDWAGKAL